MSLPSAQAATPIPG